MQEFLRLRSLQPVASGKQRHVFVHPTEPDLIVKVPTQRYVLSRAGKIGKWYKTWHKSRTRARHNLVFQREIHEHLALHAAGTAIPHHVQRIVAFAETDFGLGLVTRAVRDRSGGLAPTLIALLAENRFGEEARKNLDRFIAWLLESPVIIGDLHGGNLLYGYDEAVGDHFVMVDGLGEKNLIPLNSLSRRLNRWSKKRRIRRLKRQIASFPTSEARTTR